MLVIDLVVGCLGDHVAEIGVLEDEDAVGLEQMLHARRDSRQVGDVAHHIGGEDGVGAAMFGDDVVGKFAIEESADGADAAAARDVGDIDGRLDAEMTDAALMEMAQHDAVIAAEFDDERIGRPVRMSSITALANALEMRSACSARCWNRRHIAVEHLLGLRLLDELKHAALLAKCRRELEEIFVRDFVRGQESRWRSACGRTT